MNRYLTKIADALEATRTPKGNPLLPGSDSTPNPPTPISQCPMPPRKMPDLSVKTID